MAESLALFCLAASDREVSIISLWAWRVVIFGSVLRIVILTYDNEGCNEAAHLSLDRTHRIPRKFKASVDLLNASSRRTASPVRSD